MECGAIRLDESARIIVAIRWAIAGLIFLAIGLALGVFVAGDQVIPVELDGMLLLQRLGWRGLDGLAWAVSRLGDALPSLLLISLLAAAACAYYRRLDLAVVVLAASLVRGLGPLLKWLFGSPRPPVDVVSVLERTSGFGYPSGHAFGATLVYGSIALFVSPLIQSVALRNAVRGVAITLVVLIALSRVRLGVHWLSDASGGVAFGLAALCFLQAGLHGVGNRRVKT